MSDKKLTRDVHLKAPMTFPADVPDGTFLARFSAYNKIDSQGDVVLPGAIPNGVERAMIWSHKWGDYPIAKGVTETDETGANLRGQFFMDTDAGVQSYRTVKNMGDLQEYSFGFRVLDAEFGMFDDQPVRFVKAVELFEVSPVLVGAQRDTGTVAIKSGDPSPGAQDDDEGGDDDDDDFDAASAILDEAEEFLALDDAGRLDLYYASRAAGDDTSWKAVWSTAYVNNLPDSAFAAIEAGGTRDSSGKTTPRSLRHFPHHATGGSADAPHVRNGLARVSQADISQALKDKAAAHLKRHASGMGIGTSGDMPNQDKFVDHLDRVLDELFDAQARAQSVHDLRAKDARKLSPATIARITEIGDQAVALAGTLHDLVDAAQPAKADVDAIALKARFLKFEHEANEYEAQRRAVV